MTTSLERRDWFVDAAARKAKAMGAPVSTDALQRQMASDLTMLDNVRAAGLLTVKRDAVKKSPLEVLAEKRSLKAESLAAKVGGAVRRRQLPKKDRPEKGITLTGVEAEKFRAIVQRLYLIGQRVRSIKVGEEMSDGFEYKALADRIQRLQLNHDKRAGIFAGKSEKDRWRIRFATLQSICDDSNAVCGFGWWVKK